MANPNPIPFEKRQRKNKLLQLMKRRYGTDFHPIMKQAELAIKMEKLATATEANSEKSSRDKLLAFKAAADTWDKVAPYIASKRQSIKVEHTHTASISIRDALQAAVDHATQVIEGEVIEDGEVLSVEDASDLVAKERESIERGGLYDDDEEDL